MSIDRFFLFIFCNCYEISAKVNALQTFIANFLAPFNYFKLTEPIIGSQNSEKFAIENSNVPSFKLIA